MNKLFSGIFAVLLAAIFNAHAIAPAILTQPQSLTINNASTAAFAVVADTNALAYQWQFNGASIPSATNATLTLENVTTNQAGAYTVVVRSSDTSVTSQPPAQLTLVPGTVVRFIFSGLLGGGTNFVDVQLFDHDKPATVRNFIQYITAGAYTNMFFDRCVGGFVLQGGDDDAADRTNQTSPVTGWNISEFVGRHNYEPPFSTGVTNEFSSGPLIHNDFGTIAMAKQGGLPNSATSAFFFNLADNSGNLDNQNGGFTVFGRVISSTNALQYFNNLTLGDGLVNNGEFLDLLSGGAATAFPNPPLPVNYAGSALPANTNLVFCDFQFLNVDTNPPVLSIASPAGGVDLTNGTHVTVQGLASDDIALAWVRAELIPLSEPDGAIPNHGVAVTNYATGLPNWSVNLINLADASGLVPPGRYTLEVEAQDEAGNIARQSQPLSITALLINGNGSVSVTSNSVTLSNPIGYPLQIGSTYSLTAMPATNNLFLSYRAGGISSSSENLSFPVFDGETLSATFISNNLPGAIAVTYPASNAVVNIGPITVTGTISGLPSAQITCQLYNASSTLNYGPPVTTTAAAQWSVTLTNLVAGSYTLQVVATDPAGESTELAENFTASRYNGDTNPPALSIASPPSGLVMTNGDYVTVVGTASDNNGLALVRAELIPLREPDGAIPNHGISSTNYASALTNWSINLNNSADAYGLFPPGRYTLEVEAQDDAGNFVQQSQPLTITAVLVNGNGTITVSSNNVTLSNPIGYPLQIGSQYDLIPNPAPSNLFVNFSDQGISSISANLPFPLSEGEALTATFVSNDIPGSVAITYPASNAIVNIGALTITGTLAGVPSATITCQLYDASSELNATPPLTTTGTNNWSVTLTNLAAGSYILQVVAVDPAGRGTMITQNFSAGEFTTAHLNIIGGGTVSGVTDSESLEVGTIIFVTAKPKAGQLFYEWSDGATTSLNPAQTYFVSGNLTLTASFYSKTSPKGVSFTSPAPNAKLTNGNITVAGRVSSGVKPLQITAQIFSALNGSGVGSPMSSAGSTTWSLPNQVQLSPGQYILDATSVDANGGKSFASEKFSVLAPIHLVTEGLGTLSLLRDGQYLEVGTQYSVRATPKPGQVFDNWSDGSTLTINPVKTFTMPASTNLTLTATFISNDLAGGISFSYPKANAQITTNNFTLSGTIKSGLVVTQITCQLFGQSGAVTAAQTAAISGSSWSVMETNMSLGKYTVVAIAYDSLGRSTLISESFTVNFFAAVAGTYSGLFLNTTGPIAPTNSGLLTVQVTPAGVFSGKLYFPAYGGIPIIYGFNAGGNTQLGSGNFHGTPISIALSLDLTNGTDTLTGTIASPFWSSQLICYRAITRQAAGSYILSLQPENAALGNGYATVSATSGGTMTLAGALPDNSSFSDSAYVSKDGVWAVYASPSGYGTKGMLMGWETNGPAGSVYGQLYWYKAPKIGLSGTNSFQVASIGTNFARPAAGGYSVVFGGGNMAAAQTVAVTVNNKGQFVAGSSANQLTLSLSAGGVLTGHIANPGGSGLLQFKGALLGGSQGGSGFTVTPQGGLGYFTLEP